MSDLGWLKELEVELWPKKQREEGRANTPHGAVQIKLHAKRRLTKEEWGRVCRTILEEKLVVEMVGTNMFGGVGIVVYEHPVQPGMDHEYVLTLTQDHLPGEEDPKPTLGSCLRKAWEVFSEFTHSDQNKAWLKKYGLAEPREAPGYDY